MIKVEIKNKSGQVTHGGTFKDQSEVDAWIAEVRPTGAWGKPSGVYNQSQLSEQEKIGAIEILHEGDQTFTERQFQIEDQFSIVTLDITAEVEQENKRLENIKNKKKNIRNHLATINQATTIVGVKAATIAVLSDLFDVLDG